MPYDETLAARVRDCLARRRGLSERTMFGGICFMLRGNMCCGVLNDELIVRVAHEDTDATLDADFTRPFDFTGKPMNGFVVVLAPGVEAEVDLRSWVKRAADHAASLPPKPGK